MDDESHSIVLLNLGIMTCRGITQRELKRIFFDYHCTNYISHLYTLMFHIRRQVKAFEQKRTGCVQAYTPTGRITFRQLLVV